MRLATTSDTESAKIAAAIKGHDVHSTALDELAALRASGEFDEDWYLEHFPDVKMLGMDPAEHYLWIGKRLGRAPNPAFSRDAKQQARHQIIRTFEGECQVTDALCLFSHYDLHSKIDEYVLAYLQSLTKCGFSIVFITTCEDIGKAELEKVIPLVTKIIVKKNIGRDFGAWFTGIVDSWNFKEYRKLLLANDSVYGPIFDLKSVFEDMGDRDLDLWGITDSFEVDYHLQTYFVVFEERILNSDFFTDFWNGYTFEVDKRKVIDNYEIGLTSLALKHDFRVGALCPYYDVRRRALRLVDQPEGMGRAARQALLTPVNSSHFFWRALIQTSECPFLKIELLRDNPSNIDDVLLWEDVVRESSEFNIGLIKNHLHRVKMER